MISVFGSDMSDLELLYLRKCLESQWIGFGKVVTEFELKLQKIRNFPNFTMVDSGSNALYLALKLLNLPKGSEVVLPAFTWIACANAVVLAGMKPIFADVDPVTMNITSETIKEKISPRTSAVMVVHFAGMPVDLDPIRDLELKIIEDAAHAIYSNYKGSSCGTIGDIGVFSFDSVKNLAVGEGGGLVCKDNNLSEHAKNLRYCGIQKSGFQSAVQSFNVQKQEKMWWEYELSEPFIKMLPTNLSASLGLAQLERKEELQSIRENIWNIYDEGLGELRQIVCPTRSQSFAFTHSYFTYVIRTKNRDELAKFLLKNGVYTTLRYHPLDHYSQFQPNMMSTPLPNTASLSKEALSLPIHPRLTINEIHFIIDLIRKYYR